MTAADRARAGLVDGLLTSGRIRSPAVEEALRTVPRHLFLPGVTLQTAYADDTVAVQYVDGLATSSASQPSMVAIMLEQLDLRPGHRVLEIGAGTGWNAALMARIVGPAGRVTTVDIDPDLVAGTTAHLAAAEVATAEVAAAEVAAAEVAAPVEVICADGVLGHPEGAPYDRIVLTVGSGDIWPAWVEQLAPDGRLLLPLGLRGSQLSVALDLASDGRLHSHSVRSCGFIRLRGSGASVGPSAALPGGLTLHGTEDGPAFDPGALAAVLDEPGEPVTSPVRLVAADVWDGFGLWLALTEPGAGRLMGAATGPLASAVDSLALVLATAAGAAQAGVAALVSEAEGGASTVRPFGAAGPACADRLLDALDTWVAAGSPAAPDWRITVVPGPAPPGAAAVGKEHCHLLLEPARRAGSTGTIRPPV